MFERFTERAREIVVLAQDEARQFKHPAIDSDHILVALVREEHGIASRVLRDAHVSVEQLRDWIQRTRGEGGVTTYGQIPFTPASKKTLEMALREALSLGNNYISTEHILLGLVRAENEASIYLRDMGLSAEKIRDKVVRKMTGESDPIEDSVIAAARQVHTGLSELIVSALLIEKGLKVIIDDLERRAGTSLADSPPSEKP